MGINGKPSPSNDVPDVNRARCAVNHPINEHTIGPFSVAFRGQFFSGCGILPLAVLIHAKPQRFPVEKFHGDESPMVRNMKRD